MGEGKYRKHFIPLESNPEVFTKLSHKLGITETLSFVEVLELKEVERPPYRALALVLVFPTSEEYEQRRSAEDVGRQDDNETNKDGLIWLPQTINNACGLYAILHAACNGVAKLSIRPESLLAKFVTAFQTQQPQDYAKILEGSIELELLYKEAAMQGDSNVPTDAQAEVDFHYVCFVETEHRRIYEMDGDRKGPIDKEVTLEPGDDMLSSASLSLVRDYIDREGDGAIAFNLMALVELSE